MEPCAYRLIGNLCQKVCTKFVEMLLENGWYVNKGVHIVLASECRC